MKYGRIWNDGIRNEEEWEDKVVEYTYLKRKFRITEGSFFRGQFFTSFWNNRSVWKMKAVIRSANRNTTLSKESPETAYTVEPVREKINKYFIFLGNCFHSLTNRHFPSHSAKWQVRRRQSRAHRTQRRKANRWSANDFNKHSFGRSESPSLFNSWQFYFVSPNLFQIIS